MNPTEMQQLAELLQNVPGIKTLDLKDVRRLVELLRDSPEIGSIEVKGWFGTGVVVTRTALGAPMGVPMATPMQMLHAPMAHLPPTPPGGGVDAVRPADVGAGAAPVTALKEIRSPMVGTFYKSPEPGAPSYVKEGARVTTGQTVCIIEAMKIMNEIEAEVSGVIREICVEDSQPVEFGQVLFRVDPNG